jgi:hypothetical protein
MCIIINTRTIFIIPQDVKMTTAFAQGSMSAGLRSSSLADTDGYRGISMTVGHRDTDKVSE